ncbi:MAG: ABC transporter transmembrane domain-containing protein, partial [Stackebrandtia sp.]
IDVDATTTPRRLAFRAIFAAKRYTLTGTAMTVGHQIGEALVPVIMGLAIDRALATSDTSQLILWVVLLGLDFAMLSYCYRFGSRVSYLGMQAVQHMLRTVVTDRLLAARGVDGKTALPGVSLSIASSDVLQLSTMIALCVYPVAAFAAVLLCAIILITISWPLGVAILVGAPLLLFFLDKAGGPLQRRTDSQQAMAADAAGRATDLVTGYRVIRGIGAETVAAQRYRRTSQQALTAALHAKTANGYYLGATNLITGLFIAALAVAAGLLALTEHISIGQLITVVGLTQFIMSPLQTIAGIIAVYWPSGLASSGRVLSVLKAPHAVDIDPAITDTDLAFTGDTGWFTAEAVTAGPLRDFHLQVAPGECVGIAGEGEAARTLTELLLLRRSPETGQLSWNGATLAGRDPELVRHHILVAPHTADLFDGSITDNVALPGTDSEQVAIALDVAGCREFLDTLPDGSDTGVGEGGTRLSGGQRQRVALARALAQPAPLLVLHDPTTAVDSVTEAGIAEGIPTAL